MRKLQRLAACAAVLTVAAVFVGVAAAGNGNGPGNGNANKNPNGAQTGHFTASYNNAIGGHFTCVGQRIAKTGTNGFVKDEEECTISNAAAFFPAGTTVGNPYVFFHGLYLYWDSDFDGKQAKTITYIVSPAQPDGSAHLKIVAYY
jgi:hypothetical protein